MKFLVTKELKESPLLLHLMGMVVVTILFYVILDVFVHGYILGWNIEAIASTLYGNEEHFEEPILLDSLLLQVHIDLFMTIFALLILTSVWIRFTSSKRGMKWVLHAVLLLGLLSPLLLLLAYGVSHFFLYGWLLAFFLWHGMATMMALAVLKKWWFG